MANVVVVGAQWGDEGKGKIVDWLSSQADVVVRFQGGHNAGHTLVIDGVVYKLSLLPSGIVRPGKLSVIGNGVVVDPWHLVEEIARLHEGDCFGEISLLTGRLVPQTATVEASGNAVVLAFSRAEFAQLLDTVPAFAARVHLVGLRRLAHAAA